MPMLVSIDPVEIEHMKDVLMNFNIIWVIDNDKIEYYEEACEFIKDKGYRYKIERHNDGISILTISL